MSDNEMHNNTEDQSEATVGPDAGNSQPSSGTTGSESVAGSSVRQFYIDGVWWKRLIAAFIDGVLIGVASIILIIPGMLVLPAGTLNFQALYMFFVSAAGCAVYLMKDGPYKIGDLLDGQSPGKKAMNLRVTDLNGAPITMEMSVKRNIIPGLPYIVGAFSNLLNIVQIPIISGLATLFIVLPLMGIAFLVVLFEVYCLYSGDRNRRWGDTMAGTIVAME